MGPWDSKAAAINKYLAICQMQSSNTTYILVKESGSINKWYAFLFSYNNALISMPRSPIWFFPALKLGWQSRNPVMKRKRQGVWALAQWDISNTQQPGVTGQAEWSQTLCGEDGHGRGKILLHMVTHTLMRISHWTKVRRRGSGWKSCNFLQWGLGTYTRDGKF